CTGSTDAVSGTLHRQILFQALDVDDSLDFIAYQPQIEEKPFATPFVDGIRPVGTLSYHDLAKHFNQREFTFACWWRPYLELEAQTARIFEVNERSVQFGRRITLRR